MVSRHGRSWRDVAPRLGVPRRRVERVRRRTCGGFDGFSSSHRVRPILWRSPKATSDMGSARTDRVGLGRFVSWSGRRTGVSISALGTQGRDYSSS
ncbi:helix-turn-helix domain-containing protein [Lacipirellula limnantheis]|uniref:helix-turn-helix domain-containing protein n=1 Tax=Lacipirellula limnantheis TaxID=2528024 RepID=UPI00143D7DD3